MRWESFTLGHSLHRMRLCKLPDWSIGDFRVNQYHNKSVRIDGIHTEDLEELKYEIVSQSTVIVIDQISTSVRIT